MNATIDSILRNLTDNERRTLSERFRRKGDISLCNAISRAIKSAIAWENEAFNNEKEVA